MKFRMQFFKNFYMKKYKIKKYVVRSAGKSVPKGNILKEYTDKIVCAPKMSLSRLANIILQKAIRNSL